MDASSAPLHFDQARIGAAFLIAFGLGLAAAGGWFLLRPWPPRVSRWLQFAAVLVVAAGMLGYGSYRRTVDIDPGQRQVIEQVRYLGLGPATRRSFGEYLAVQVEYRDAASGYTLCLLRPGQRVALTRLESVLDAENAARALADLGGWKAQRYGYRLGSSLGAGDAGLSVGSLQAFKTPSGRTGVSLALEDLLRVIPAPGEESAIAP